MREPTFHNEGDVKNQVKKLLKAHGWTYRMPAANGYGKAGLSDFICLRAGVYMAIETKFGKNKPTAQQKEYLNEVMIQDGFAFVVTDQNLDWFKAWLEAFDRSCESVGNGREVSPDDGGCMLNAIKALTEAFA